MRQFFKPKTWLITFLIIALAAIISTGIVFWQIIKFRPAADKTANNNFKINSQNKTAQEKIAEFLEKGDKKYKNITKEEKEKMREEMLKFLNSK